MKQSDSSSPDFDGFFSRPDDHTFNCCGECIAEYRRKGREPFFNEYWWQWMANPLKKIMERDGKDAAMVFIYCGHN